MDPEVDQVAVKKTEATSQRVIAVEEQAQRTCSLSVRVKIKA